MSGKHQSMDAANLGVYNNADVVSHYAVLDYLTQCEQLLFDLYIGAGAAVLDLGVGGGRTTPYLSSGASLYVGVDNASEMIRMCRMKHPDLEFVEAEASDLSAFAACSFDAVVIAFNGLDYVIPDGKRERCCKECYRVLKPKGVLLFSSHNPRSILLRSTWNRERIRSVAQTFAGGSSFIIKFAVLALSLAASARAFLRAAWGSVRRATSRIPCGAFWRGEGYLLDPAHGGLTTHCWVPYRVIADLQKQQFRIEKVLGDDYPHASGEYTTDWYYYVFSKSNSTEDGETCA
jgi:ubiquinone/menaquinone biosynthesis C-methylase UbiE